MATPPLSLNYLPTYLGLLGETELEVRLDLPQPSGGRSNEGRTETKKGVVLTRILRSRQCEQPLLGLPQYTMLSEKRSAREGEASVTGFAVVLGDHAGDAAGRSVGFGLLSRFP